METKICLFIFLTHTLIMPSEIDYSHKKILALGQKFFEQSISEEKLKFLYSTSIKNQHSFAALKTGHDILFAYREQLLEYEKYLTGEKNNLEPEEILFFQNKYNVHDQEPFPENVQKQVLNSLSWDKERVKYADACFKCLIRKSRISMFAAKKYGASIRQ